MGSSDTVDLADLRAAVAVTDKRARLAMGSIATVWIAGAIRQALDWLRRPVVPDDVHGLVKVALLEVFPMSIIQIIAIVFYCRWLYRAYADTKRLGGLQLTRSPADAVASFFIPIICLYRPYQVLRDLHAASDPRTLPDLPQYRPPAETAGYRLSAREEVAAPRWSFPFPVRAWWACYTAIPIVSAAICVTFATKPALANQPAIIHALNVADLPIWLLAAVFAVQVIRSIQGRQDERLRRLVAEAASNRARTVASAP
jgi:hypothetical protein